ncbi:MAG: helix-turn-helix transcriptional regulator [Phycisphaerae bacterium]|jgi:transcriptional regulator with XRE-family HTH domain
MSKKDATLVRLGQNLRLAREAKGWSQEELAMRCGVHRTYVGAVERGEYNVTILTLKKFTDTLGISLAKAIAGLS